MGSSSSFVKKLKFIIKGIGAIIALLIGSVYGVVCSIILTLLGKKKLSQWSTARFFYHLFSRLMGIKINIDHPERLEDLPAILISNHQTELDIFMLGRIFPKRCTVTAKKQLKYIPFLGWFMSLSGTFFIDRSNRENAVKTLDDALQDLKNNKDGLFMFPEGTRSYSTKPILLPFKKGAFHLAVSAGIPIVPLIVSNYSNIYSPKLKNFNTGEINIKVLEPIPTHGLTTNDVGKLVEETYAKMNQAVKELGFSDVYGDFDTGVDNIEDTQSPTTTGFTSNNVSPVKNASSTVSSTKHTTPEVITNESGPSTPSAAVQDSSSDTKHASGNKKLDVLADEITASTTESVNEGTSLLT